MRNRDGQTRAYSLSLALFPLFLIEFIRNLGLGKRLTVALVVLLVVAYLFRGKQWASRISGILATAWLIVITVGITVAAAVFLGWIDANPGLFVGDVGRWATALWRRLSILPIGLFVLASASDRRWIQDFWSQGFGSRSRSIRSDFSPIRARAISGPSKGQGEIQR